MDKTANHHTTHTSMKKPIRFKSKRETWIQTSSVAVNSRDTYMNRSMRKSECYSYRNVSEGLWQLLHWQDERFSFPKHRLTHFSLFFRSTFSSTLVSISHPSLFSIAHFLLLTSIFLLFFHSWCSSRQPSWLPVTVATWRPAWRFRPHRSTRWGRWTSTASLPPPWPRCRVSFISLWVSNCASFPLLLGQGTGEGRDSLSTGLHVTSVSWETEVHVIFPAVSTHMIKLM